MLCAYLLLTLFLLILYLAYANQKLNSFSSQYFILYIFIGILLIIATTFRPEVMPDYDNYAYAYRMGSTRLEPTFIIIREIGHIFTNSHLIMMFIYASISITITMIAIYKNSPTLWYSMLIWLSYIFILQDMIQIRQAIASAAFLYSIPYIESRNLKKYIIINLLAACFHFSALAVLPLYFLSPHKKYTIFYISLIPISILLFLSNMKIVFLIENINIDFIAQLWSTKANTLQETENVTLFNKRQIIQYCLCIFLWCKINKITTIYPSALIYLKIYTIAIATFILFFDIPDIASRLNVLFIIVEIIIVPITIISLSPQSFWKLLTIGIATLFFTTYYYRYVVEPIL